MSVGLKAYRLVTRCIEPIAGLVLSQRVKQGKEDGERLDERYGRSMLRRPTGRLIWLHGASVGETTLLIDLFQRLQKRAPDIRGLFTSQTMTSSALFERRKLQGAVHQMAPIDGPSAIRRFFDHWRPDIGILAEGELWPNMLRQADETGVPMALINARMTDKTLNNWYSRPAAAREIFGPFEFIGAADENTANGLRRATGRIISVVGNLKQAADAPGVDDSSVEAWRQAIGERPVLLAASTHSGEEKIAVNAFQNLRNNASDPLLIIAPRHPDREQEAAQVLKETGLAFKVRTKDPSVGCKDPVLLAATMGEMGLWMRLSKAVYLGGGHKEGVGGHNPIEPLKLRRPVHSGPHVFNFSQIMEPLTKTGGATLGDDEKALEDFWQSWINGSAVTPQWDAIDSIFEAVEKPLQETINALAELIMSGEHA